MPMVSSVRRRLTAEDRRAKILAAAVRAFAVNGYDNTSMNRIAVLAKVTKPVLYDHFSSKQSLFLTVLKSIRNGLIAKGKVIAEAGNGPEEIFRRSVDAFLQFIEQQPDAARVLLMVPRSNAAAVRISREVQAGASAGIACLLANIMPGSSPWRLLVAAEFLKEGLHAVAKWWLKHPGPSREELVNVITGLVLPRQLTNEPERR